MEFSHEADDRLIAGILKALPMLAEAVEIQKIILAVVDTDFHKGAASLTQLIGTKYDLSPFEKELLFLFCSRRTDRIKELIWEGNGFLLLYKRLEDGTFS